MEMANLISAIASTKSRKRIQTSELFLETSERIREEGNCGNTAESPRKSLNERSSFAKNDIPPIEKPARRRGGAKTNVQARQKKVGVISSALGPEYNREDGQQTVSDRGKNTLANDSKRTGVKRIKTTATS